MSVTKGIYRHYKGNLYEVIDMVQHSETEEDLVLYRALYGKRGLWVRPLSLFLEPVLLEGKSVNRFSLIDEALSVLHELCPQECSKEDTKG